jgi:hypothetical protein
VKVLLDVGSVGRRRSDFVGYKEDIGNKSEGIEVDMVMTVLYFNPCSTGHVSSYASKKRLI